MEVPYGADSDGAALSRPNGKPEQTVDNHETHYRLSLLSGDTEYDPNTFALRHYESELHDLLAVGDAVEMHQQWLDSELMTAFNESTFHPYTSLKYHTLLVAALVGNYREGHSFDELQLVVDDGETVVPHRTVYSGDRFGLRITGRETTNPRARLGSRPWRSWASVWGRLSDHPPLDTDDRFEMFLDANLRRIQSWSVALQYIEDYTAWRGDAR